ncbi:MAG: hypothetical protein IBX71_11715 [Candidatus Desulforudis sp.]|nr:hypothetical protein [Desulforudis sp.]
MRFRVRNENFIFIIVVLAVLLVGLVTALVIGGWYKYPPVMERSSQAPAAGPDVAVPVAGGGPDTFLPGGDHPVAGWNAAGRMLEVR